MRVVGLTLVLACARAAAADTCAEIDDRAPVTVATAGAAGEYAFAVNVESASATKWSERGNEALVQRQADRRVDGAK